MTPSLARLADLRDGVWQIRSVHERFEKRSDSPRPHDRSRVLAPHRRVPLAVVALRESERRTERISTLADIRSVRFFGPRVGMPAIGVRGPGQSEEKPVT